jgi:hypothetical protein
MPTIYDELKNLKPNGGFIPIQKKSKKLVSLSSGVSKSTFATIEAIMKK